VKLRLLDKKKVRVEELKWKLVNTCLPVLLILIFGISRYYLRKKKYSS